MEKIKSDYDHKDYMRMAMLKHEETFREQVYELHRLYRMQKALMQNVGLTQQHALQQQQQQKQERFLVERKSNKEFTVDYNQELLLSEAAQRSTLTNVIAAKSHQSNISSIMGLQQQQRRPEIDDDHRRVHIAESNNNTEMVLNEESEIELTLSLGPMTHNPRRRRTDSGHESLSSSSTGSSQTKKSSPTNISNNISSLTRGEHHHHRNQFTWGSSTNFPQGSDLEPGFSNAQPNNSPWLFQALSLKLT